MADGAISLDDIDLNEVQPVEQGMHAPAPPPPPPAAPVQAGAISLSDINPEEVEPVTAAPAAPPALRELSGTLGHQPDDGTTALWRGVRRMIPTTVANLAQGGAVVSHLFGAGETAASLEGLGNRLEASADVAARRRVPDIEHIHDTGTLLTWAGETLGEQSGSILASVLSGVVGAGAAGILGTAKAIPYIGRAFAWLTATRGAAAGAALGSFVQNSGDTFNNIRTNTPKLPAETAAMWAAGAGVPMAALDVLSLRSLLSPILGQAANAPT